MTEPNLCKTCKHDGTDRTPFCAAPGGASICPLEERHELRWLAHNISRDREVTPENIRKLARGCLRLLMIPCATNKTIEPRGALPPHDTGDPENPCRCYILTSALGQFSVRAHIDKQTPPICLHYDGAPLNAKETIKHQQTGGS